jgi:ketosteroid isomerase-like protein
MPRLLSLAAALYLILVVALPALAQQPPQQTKLKIKDGEVRDKSKPVRVALEAWYQRNMAAFAAKDVAAVMTLRTDDFHTITPDGPGKFKTNTRADMEARTVTFLSRIDHFISQRNDIGTIELDGDTASADVHQRTVRMQRFPDGSLHQVDASVVQRETWKHTPDGWKLYRVDNIRDGPLLVDGKPWPPAK